ncbi:MAG: hypothetical protein M1837_005699 [Sclerophora amabilis]|nr:MAG: hypothetical protein M1837_005699 [Sclerophora amabilis]
MPTLDLVLTPEAVGRIHDALVCLSKFSESVSIEARRDKLLLTALNSSKSAYACFTLDSRQFFSKYYFVPEVQQSGDNEGGGRFSCSIYNKALLSVFKGRLMDARDKDTAIERCEISIQDRPEKAECRLVVKMICRHGVLKTYRLTYEPFEAMHALFDKTTVRNRWSVSSKMLKEFSEHFGPKTEQLDMYSENGRVIFTSYTDKIVHQNGRKVGFIEILAFESMLMAPSLSLEILKQPLQTSIAVDTMEFEEFAVEEKLHIAISVKDFKAIVTHAESLNASVSAAYSYPTRPLQFAHQGNGTLCEFTLMTIGDFRAASVTPAPMAARSIVSRPSAPPPITAPREEQEPRSALTAMAPPERPEQRAPRERATGREGRPSPPPPKPSVDRESLFFTQDDDDRRWDEQNYGDEEEDFLTWDVNAHNNASRSLSRSVQDSRAPEGLRPDANSERADEKGIAPTQRLSQVRGLFDD